MPYPEAAIAAILNGHGLFPLGFSWGGYESLILPVDPRAQCGATTWTAPGPVLHVHAGLEDPHDLIADLARGFAPFNAAARN